MNEQKPIELKEQTTLFLFQLQTQLFNDMLRVQHNLREIEKEIERRENGTPKIN